MMKTSGVLLLFCALWMAHTAIIPLSTTISTPADYRNLITLRYAELHKHNLVRHRHQVPLVRLSSKLCSEAQIQAEAMLAAGRAGYSKDAMAGRIGENIYGAFSVGPIAYKPFTASNYWYRLNDNYDY